MEIRAEARRDRGLAGKAAALLLGLALVWLALGAARALAGGDGDGTDPTGPGFAAQGTPGAGGRDCPDRGDEEGTTGRLLAAQSDAATPVDETVADVAEAATPSVVTVTNLRAAEDGDEPEATGTGSGFVWEADGERLVVTNSHVVRGATGVTVTLADGTEIPATVVGTDWFQDVAVLRLDPPAGTELPDPLPRGEAASVRAGESVVAIGSALGEFANTVTTGTVGAVGRSLDAGTYRLPNLIQHDAPIWPGNSGGPILDLEGRVVGMNVAGLETRSDAPINFAIDVDAVGESVERILAAGGDVARPYLGIEGEAIRGGQAVTTVLPDGPAAAAGLRAGDVITAVAGAAVDEETPLMNRLFAHEPGETVTLTVDRDGAEVTVEVTLGERPAERQ